MKVLPLDISKPSYRAAFHHARVLAVAGDRKGADALLSRLLWHVPAADGGFIGLTDCQIAAKVALDERLDRDVVAASQWDPGEWPAQPAAQQVAA